MTPERLANLRKDFEAMGDRFDEKLVFGELFAAVESLRVERDDAIQRAEKAERELATERSQQWRVWEVEMRQEAEKKAHIAQALREEGAASCAEGWRQVEELRAKLAACVAALESIQAIECEIDHDAIEVDCASLIARRALAAAKGSAT